eukprot:scaffold3761_cov81-Skeletonema_marinoi.AAC.4
MEVCSVERRYNQFDEYVNLTSIDLVGRVHITISSLLLESWRDDMNQEIDRINQTLPKTGSSGKAAEISNWMQHIIARMEYYKTEHNRLLKEHMTQLELALWKAKIDEKEKERYSGKVQARKAHSDEEKQDIVKNGLRVTCGARKLVAYHKSLILEYGAYTSSLCCPMLMLSLEFEDVIRNGVANFADILLSVLYLSACDAKSL